MKRFLFIAITTCFAFAASAQFTDSAQANNYIRNNIRDKRPDKVTAEQIQTAILGVSNLARKRADSLHNTLKNKIVTDTNHMLSDTAITAKAVNDWVAARLAGVGSSGVEADPLFDTKFTGKSTDNLTEGATNKYYTDSRARAAINVALPLSFDGTSGNFTLDTTSATGVAGRSRVYKVVDSTFRALSVPMSLAGDVYGTGGFAWDNGLGRLTIAASTIVQKLNGFSLPNMSTGTGLLKWLGSGTGWVFDNNTYMTVTDAVNALEFKSNKATTFTTLNNTLYPTTLAVSNFLAANYAPAARNITFVISSPYTVTATDFYLVLNAGSGTINLPDPATNNNRELVVNAQRFYGSTGGSISFDRYVYVANDGAVADSTTSQANYTSARYRSNGTKWVKVESSYQFITASTSGTGASLVKASSTIGVSANGNVSSASIKRIKQGAGIQVNDLGDEIEIVNTGTGTGGTDSANLYVQWPLKMANDSTIKEDKADATHDGYLDSLDYARMFVRQTATDPTGTITLNIDAGGQSGISLATTGGRTLAFSNLRTGDIFKITFNNTSGATVTLTLPSNSFIAGTGTASTVTIPTGRSMLTLTDYDGTNYLFAQQSY